MKDDTEERARVRQAYQGMPDTMMEEYKGWGNKGHRKRDGGRQLSAEQGNQKQGRMASDLPKHGQEEGRVDAVKDLLRFICLLTWGKRDLQAST